MQHLPILQVIIPLLAAPLCLIIGHGRLAWLFAMLVSVTAMLISILLLQQVYAEGAISYMLGGWEPPWGIEYRIDVLNAYVLLVVSGIGTCVLLSAHTSIQKEIDSSKHALFYVMYLLCFAGLLGIAATGDAFNVFVFLEISSLATYALIALGPDRRALWASYQYLIMGTIGATFILISIGFMYILTGTLNMQDLAARLPESSSSTAVMTALAFFVVGVCLKLALFPLHVWLPNAYAFAPSIVTAFLAATATKVAIYLLIRFSYSIFTLDLSHAVLPLQQIFEVLGLVGVFSASLVAIYQTNIKRLFAYSSVAQIGYMVVGIGLGTVAGLQACLMHLFNHALMKGALFLALTAVMHRIGATTLESLSGLGKRMPLTSAAIVVGGLSLIGVPLTAGFISKWYLVIAAIQNGAWWVAALVLLGSVLAVFYIWRIVETMYFSDPSVDMNPADSTLEAPLSILIPTWILVLANVYFGVDTRLTVAVSDMAAQILMGGSP